VSCLVAAVTVPAYATWQDFATPVDGAPTSLERLSTDYVVRAVSHNRVNPSPPLPMPVRENTGFDTKVVFLSGPPPSALQRAIDEAAAHLEAAREAARQATEAAQTWHVPVASYYISSDFAEMRDEGPHIGLDFAGTEGKPVVAARHGTVTEAGWQGGYGYRVVIDHGSDLTTLYGHLVADPRVSVGQAVVGGEVIGYVGSTGDSTGPHLHFELRHGGAHVDPMAVFDIPRTRGDQAS